MCLATACLVPSLRVEVPSTFAAINEAVAYWLSNPLLPAGRVAATQEHLPAMGLGDKQALVLRLIKFIERERLSYRYDSTAYNLLLHTIRHELVSTEERTGLKPHLLRLRGPETEWEYTRLSQAIKQREYAANEHADAA